MGQNCWRPARYDATVQLNGLPCTSAEAWVESGVLSPSVVTATVDAEASSYDGVDSAASSLRDNQGRMLLLTKSASTDASMSLRSATPSKSAPSPSPATHSTPRSPCPARDTINPAASPGPADAEGPLHGRWARRLAGGGSPRGASAAGGWSRTEDREAPTRSLLRECSGQEPDHDERPGQPARCELLTRPFFGGRYWDRTSDLFGVNADRRWPGSARSAVSTAHQWAWWR